LAWVQQVAGESLMEMAIPVLDLLTGATVVIVNTTEVAILKAGIEMVSHHLLLKKSADLHGEGMMAVHQDYHPDHRLWIIMMED